MGVDFYNCTKCNEIFDDCSGYYDTCEKCGERVCFECQVDLNMRSEAEYFDDGAEPIGDYWEKDDKWNTLVKCPYCDGTIITDEEIIKYLLGKFNKTKDEVIAEIKASET